MFLTFGQTFSFNIRDVLNFIHFLEASRLKSVFKNFHFHIKFLFNETSFEDYEAFANLNIDLKDFPCSEIHMNLLSSRYTHKKLNLTNLPSNPNLSKLLIKSLEHFFHYFIENILSKLNQNDWKFSLICTLWKRKQKSPK